MSKKKAPKKSATVFPGSNRPKDPNTVRVRDVDPSEQIDITIKLRGPKLPSPDDYVGQTLSPDELSSKFGASQKDADEVARVLKKYGFKVESVTLPTRNVAPPAGECRALRSTAQFFVVLWRRDDMPCPCLRIKGASCYV